MPLQSQKESASTSWFAITAHDTNEVADVRAIYIGGAGNIVLTGYDDVDATFTVPAGTTLIVNPKLVKSTGTTASGIVGMT